MVKKVLRSAEKFSGPFPSLRYPSTSDKKTTNKHKHFLRDGFRDKQEPSLGQTGTPPWDKVGPVPETNWPFSVEFHNKIAILSRLSLDGWGFVPRTIVPQGPSEKCLCVFCFFFFAPNYPSPIKDA